jgi:chromosome partitioning protein
MVPESYRPRVIAIANQKGGVGKTTTTINMGAAMAEEGRRVLIVDLDPQANATTGLGVSSRGAVGQEDQQSVDQSIYEVLSQKATIADILTPTGVDGLDLVPSSLALAGAEIELVTAFSREHQLARALEPVLGDYDIVLIDCPPALGLLTINALVVADEVLVPIQCEYYALEGLGQLMGNVELVKANLNPDLHVSTIVLVMFDARTKLSEQVADEVRAHFGERVCRQVIPRSVRLSEAPSYGQPITSFDPTCRGAVAYRQVAKEVLT